MNSNVEFKFNYDRHSSSEWLVYAGKKSIVTAKVVCLVVTTTEIIKNKAYITGNGQVLAWSETIVVFG